MEFVDGGDIYKAVKKMAKDPSKVWSEEDIWYIFIQIVRGLQCLHIRKIMHRDIKSANIFITKDNIAKIGDLNVSKVMKGNIDMSTTQTGTPYYASPEIWKEKPYGYKADIWSVGCIVWEMITLKPPF
jgi:NIMA (never in mitosis gene a)-related kinase